MLNPAFAAEREREREVTAGPRRGPSPVPPSLMLQQTVQQARTPTTYGFPPQTSPQIRIGGSDNGSIDSGGGQFTAMPPPTPAYPAYPTAPQTPSPFAQAPLANTQAGIGPAVEIRRDRGAAQGPRALVPPTPGPTVSTSFNTDGGSGMLGPPMNLAQQGAHDGAVVLSPRGQDDDKLVVSIGLVPQQRSGDDTDDDEGPRKIYPLDRFTLDVFVFNQSTWTRRLELSYPNARQRRKDRPVSTGYFPAMPDSAQAGKMDAPGMIALENRVRIGRVAPSAFLRID
jgi:hypothetical protein